MLALLRSFVGNVVAASTLLTAGVDGLRKERCVGFGGIMGGEIGG